MLVAALADGLALRDAIVVHLRPLAHASVTMIARKRGAEAVAGVARRGA